MARWKCRRGGPTSPAAAVALLGGFLSAGVATRIAAQVTILPPDAAAREYRGGRDAAERGDWTEAIRRLSAALATGHDRPVERLGTARYAVERYDPDYWLGVAYMESGDETRALLHLTRARSFPAVAGWPEFADLTRRIADLERRSAARRAPSTPPPAATTPTPPTPTAPPVEPAMAPAAAPTATPVPAVPVDASLPNAVPSAGAPPPPLPTPPPLPEPEVTAAVRALAAARWEDAAGALRALRARSPGHPSADLLEAVLLGSRYLLDGSRDESLRVAARRALETFRRRGGSRRAEETWISPSLGAALTY